MGLSPEWTSTLQSVRDPSTAQRADAFGREAPDTCESSIHEIMPIRRMNSEGSDAHRADDAGERLQLEFAKCAGRYLRMCNAQDDGASSSSAAEVQQPQVVHDVSREIWESRWHRGANRDEYTYVAELQEAESVDDVHDVLALGGSASQHAKEGVIPEGQHPLNSQAYSNLDKP